MENFFDFDHEITGFTNEIFENDQEIDDKKDQSPLFLGIVDPPLQITSNLGQPGNFVQVFAVFYVGPSLQTLIMMILYTFWGYGVFCNHHGFKSNFSSLSLHIL